MNDWAGDNPRDRRNGEAAERRYQQMRADAGKPVEKMPATSPVDFKSSDGYEEVKDKDPAKGGLKRGCYGLEEYRVIRAVGLRGQILYVIHDHMAAGGRLADETTLNRPEDWFAADLRELARIGPDHIETGLTYFGGVQATAQTWYWECRRFGHLEAIVGRFPARMNCGGGWPLDWLKLAARGLENRTYEPWIDAGMCAVCPGDHPSCRSDGWGYGGNCRVASCPNPHHSALRKLHASRARRIINDLYKNEGE